MRKASDRYRAGGCLKTILMIVAGLVALAIAGGFYVYQHAGGWFRDTGSAAIRTAGEKMIEKLGLPDDQKKEALKSVEGLASKVQSGQITAVQAAHIAKVLLEPRSMAALITLYFPARFVDPSELTAPQKQAAHDTVQRYARAVADGKVPEKDLNAFIARVTEQEKVGFRERAKLRTSLTADELSGCLKMMGEAADTAGVPAKVEPLTIPGYLDAAIKKALGSQADAAGAAGADTGPAAGPGAGGVASPGPRDVPLATGSAAASPAPSSAPFSAR